MGAVVVMGAVEAKIAFVAGLPSLQAECPDLSLCPKRYMRAKKRVVGRMRTDSRGVYELDLYSFH